LRRAGASAGGENILEQSSGFVIDAAADNAALRIARVRFLRSAARVMTVMCRLELRASRSAAVAPAMPEPMIKTSVLSSVVSSLNHQPMAIILSTARAARRRISSERR